MITAHPCPKIGEYEGVTPLPVILKFPIPLGYQLVDKYPDDGVFKGFILKIILNDAVHVAGKEEFEMS